jgi:hypothetical protein
MYSVVDGIIVHDVSDDTPDRRSDYLDDATKTYLEQLDAQRIAMRYAESAFTILQREVQRNSDPAARERALDALTEASRSATNILATIQRHRDAIDAVVASATALRVQATMPNVWTSAPLDSTSGFNFYKLPFSTGAFSTNWKTVGDAGMIRMPARVSGILEVAHDGSFKFLDRSVSVSPFNPWLAFQASGVSTATPSTDEELVRQRELPAASGITESDQATYWRGIRDALQLFLSVSLEQLAALVGIAYPTLVSLGRRRPHPSTARAVLRLYALARDFEQARGQDATIAWFASQGREILERRGFDALKRAVIRTIYGRPRGSGGIQIQEDPVLESPAVEDVSTSKSESI